MGKPANVKMCKCENVKMGNTVWN